MTAPTSTLSLGPATGASIAVLHLLLSLLLLLVLLAVVRSPRTSRRRFTTHPWNLRRRCGEYERNVDSANTAPRGAARRFSAEVLLRREIIRRHGSSSAEGVEGWARYSE